MKLVNPLHCEMYLMLSRLVGTNMMNKFWTAIFVMFVIASLLIDNRSV